MRVVIIGGGLGGLVCGAILAREGCDVCVVEKHTVAGGGLHMFSRYGVEFETGMHVVSGFQPTGVLRKLFTYLGVFDKLNVKPADEDGFEHLKLASDGIEYKLARGKDNFIRTLSDYFPAEADNICRYVERLYEVCESIELFNLRMPTADVYTRTEMMNTSMGDFIASFTDNEQLRAVLAWNNALYGGDRHGTPAYVGALVTQFYIEGASRFVGGSGQLSEALIDVITSRGGEVITGDGVQLIDVQDRNVQKIVTQSGREITGDTYISAIHTSAMFRLMDLSKIQKSYYRRIEEIPNSYSSFTLYLTFKPGAFPYVNHTVYYLPDYDKIWDCGNYTAESWPQGIMYLTPPVTDDDKSAEKMIVNAIMRFDEVHQWENTTVGRRGQDYLDFKHRCEERMLDRLEEILPGIRTKIDKRFSATPLTIRDYYGTKQGAIYGTLQDCRNLAASHLSIHTKVHNLLLTGQNINLHGILGVPLTAIQTCGEIVGLESLLEKINNYNS